MRTDKPNGDVAAVKVLPEPVAIRIGARTISQTQRLLQLVHRLGLDTPESSRVERGHRLEHGTIRRGLRVYDLPRSLRQRLAAR